MGKAANKMYFQKTKKMKEARLKERGEFGGVKQAG